MELGTEGCKRVYKSHTKYACQRGDLHARLCQGGQKKGQFCTARLAAARVLVVLAVVELLLDVVDLNQHGEKNASKDTVDPRGFLNPADRRGCRCHE